MLLILQQKKHFTQNVLKSTQTLRNTQEFVKHSRSQIKVNSPFDKNVSVETRAVTRKFARTSYKHHSQMSSVFVYLLSYLECSELNLVY